MSNFKYHNTNNVLSDKGFKPVKDNNGATPDQIGRMDDLQEPTYPMVDPSKQKDTVVTDGFGETYYPQYVNPCAPTPTNMEFTDKVNKHIDETKNLIADDIIYSAQNDWYQGGAQNNGTADFTFDFKGKGYTPEVLDGNNGKVAPQRSKRVWPLGIPERPSSAIPMAGMSQTDGGFTFAGQQTELEAEAGAQNGKVVNQVVQKNLSGGSFNGSRGARASVQSGPFIKFAATQGNTNPDVAATEYAERNGQVPFASELKSPTSYQEKVPVATQPLNTTEPDRKFSRTIETPESSKLYGVNQEFLGNVGQDEGVGPEDTDQPEHLG